MNLSRYTEHQVTLADKLAVWKVLSSRSLAGGDTVRKLEEAFENYLGISDAVAVSSGTAALHLAMMTLGIRKGDLILTSPNSFVASANCARYLGADVDFVDIDSATGCINEFSLIERCKTSPVRAVVLVDFAGIIPRIHKIRREIPEGTVIIEDACHAVGGVFHDMDMPSKMPLVYRVGAHPWADMTVFSFHAAKVMTTGEGGMIVTHSQRYGEKLRRLRTHGLLRNEMTMLGYNYRMTDIQAALGLSQLKRLDWIQHRRAELMDHYRRGLASIEPVELIASNALKDRLTLCYHLCVINVPWDYFDTTRAAVVEQLRKDGIGTQLHYFPIPMQPYYGMADHAKTMWPNAVKHSEQALTLPLYPQMKAWDVEYVVMKLAKALKKC